LFCILDNYTAFIDVGAVLVCISAKITLGGDAFQQICVDVGSERNLALMEIIFKLIGPENTILVGKPKIVFVANQSYQKEAGPTTPQVYNIC